MHLLRNIGLALALLILGFYSYLGLSAIAQSYGLVHYEFSHTCDLTLSEQDCVHHSLSPDPRSKYYSFSAWMQPRASGSDDPVYGTYVPVDLFFAILAMAVIIFKIIRVARANHFSLRKISKRQIKVALLVALGIYSAICLFFIIQAGGLHYPSYANQPYSDQTSYTLWQWLTPGANNDGHAPGGYLPVDLAVSLILAIGLVAYKRRRI